MSAGWRDGGRGGVWVWKLRGLQYHVAVDDKSDISQISPQDPCLSGSWDDPLEEAGLLFMKLT